MNLYEALEQLNLEEQEHYHMGMMNLPKDIEDHIDEEDKAKLQSLQKAMMVQIKFDDKSTHLTPAIKFYGHWRSVGPDDLTDQDYLNIEALDKNLLPLTVRARIADVLWIQKKDYRSAIEAISTYRLLFERWFSVEKWVQAVPIIKRAIIISRQLHNNAEKELLLEIIYNCLQTNLKCNQLFLLLRLLELLITDQYGDPDQYIAVISELITDYTGPVISGIEKAYKLKQDCYRWKNDHDGVQRAFIELAEYYEAEAIKQDRNDIRGLMIATDMLKKAYQIYKQRKQYDKAIQVMKKLDPIQMKVHSSMQTIKTELDVSNTLREISTELQELNPEESLFYLLLLTEKQRKIEIENEILDSLGLFTALFSQEQVDKQGRTISRFEPLNICNPKEDAVLFEKYMHKHAAERERINGFLLRYAKNEIQKEHCITREHLRFITDGNGIIPEGREELILSALEMFFSGKEAESIYILTPQIEHIFRMIAKEVGGVTSKLCEDDTEEELGFGEILKTPELIEAYDEDILFTLKGLMVEASGSNIRNLVAHGLFDASDAKSDISAYFVCFVMKVLAGTSPKSQRLLSDNEILKKLTADEKQED